MYVSIRADIRTKIIPPEGRDYFQKRKKKNEMFVLRLNVGGGVSFFALKG